MKSTTGLGHLSGKLIACILVPVCVVVGAIGLVLPILPGLLFLGLAALIVARHSPAFAGILRRSRTFGPHLDRADRFFGLSFARRLQVGTLICLKIALDGAALAGSAVRKVFQFVMREYRRYR